MQADGKASLGGVLPAVPRRSVPAQAHLMPAQTMSVPMTGLMLKVEKTEKKLQNHPPVLTKAPSPG